MKATQASNIDEYIAGFPENIREMLEQIRATIKKAAPGATETIKYAIPTFTFHGNLVHFAAFKSHIGFYPAPTGLKAFQQDLTPFHTGKGSVQFPMDQPMPLPLVTRIVTFRVKENLEKAALKKKKK